MRPLVLLFAGLALTACDTVRGAQTVIAIEDGRDADCLFDAVRETEGLEIGPARTDISEGFGIAPLGPTRRESTVLPFSYEGHRFVLQVTARDGQEKAQVTAWGLNQCPPPDYLRAFEAAMSRLEPSLTRCVPADAIETRRLGNCRTSS